MNAEQVLELLERARAIDGRVEVSLERAVAWLPFLADYPADQVNLALHDHYSSSDRPVMPSNLLYLVKGQRERLVGKARAEIQRRSGGDPDVAGMLERAAADGRLDQMTAIGGPS